MPRGRKPILQNRKTTSINLESSQLEYLQKHGIELSEFIRNHIEALIQNNGSPVEQLRKEIEDIKDAIREKEIELNQKELLLKDLEEKEEHEQEEKNELEEFEDKKRNYVVGCINSMQSQQTYNRFWMEHLEEAWKFKTFDEAKTYVKDVWMDEGVPESKINRYLRL